MMEKAGGSLASAQSHVEMRSQGKDVYWVFFIIDGEHT